MLALGIFPGTFVLHFRGYEFLIGAGAVEYFSEVFGFKGTLFGLISVSVDEGLLRQYLRLIVLLNEEFLKEVMRVNWTLLLNLGGFS